MQAHVEAHRLAEFGGPMEVVDQGLDPAGRQPCLRLSRDLPGERASVGLVELVRQDCQGPRPVRRTLADQPQAVGEPGSIRLSHLIPAEVLRQEGAHEFQPPGRQAITKLLGIAKVARWAEFRALDAAVNEPIKHVYWSRRSE